jgi:MFS family permease
MGAAGVIVVQLIPGYAGLLIGTLLIASSSASIVPIATTVAREFGAESVGRVMGMITFLGVIAVTAPPIVAFMNEVTGGYHAPLVMLSVMGAVSALAAVLLNERKAAPVLAVA